jgi:hypothetical protein
MPTSILGEFLLCDVSLGKKSIKYSIDRSNIYLLFRELFLTSKSQVEWFSVFLDVSLSSDYSQKVRESLNTGIVKTLFPKEKLSIVFARYLFPCQTRATARSEFYKEKSSVLGEDIPARPVKGRVWLHIARGKCVSGAQRATCNAYLLARLNIHLTRYD